MSYMKRALILAVLGTAAGDYVVGSKRADDRNYSEMQGLPKKRMPDEVHQIKRVRYEDLSFQQFYTEFRQGDRPVIITGIPAQQSPCFGYSGGYNKTKLQAECKAARISVKPFSTNYWERKSCGQPVDMMFAEFLELFDRPGGLDERLGIAGPFFADWVDIQKYCGDYGRSIRIPAYFTGAVHSTCPSFYYGQKGFNQTWHVDYLPAELWTSICQGKKRFRIVPMSVAWEHLGNVSMKDMHRLLLRPSEWPLGMPIWEGEVEAGDLLWFPAGALHAVENLENSAGVVSNFIDAPNLAPLGSVITELLKDWGDWSRPFNFRGFGSYDNVSLMPVFDELGKVIDASMTPRGYPLWGILEAIHDARGLEFPLKLLENAPSRGSAAAGVS